MAAAAKRLLIPAGHVLTQDPALGLLSPGGVPIENGLIAQVGASTSKRCGTAPAAHATGSSRSAGRCRPDKPLLN